LASRAKGRNQFAQIARFAVVAGGKNQAVVLVGGQGLFEPAFRAQPEPAPARRRQPMAGLHQCQRAFGDRVVEPRQHTGNPGRPRLGGMEIERQRACLGGMAHQRGNIGGADDARRAGGDGGGLRQDVVPAHGDVTTVNTGCARNRSSAPPPGPGAG
jgi:hypothetical protein